MMNGAPSSGGVLSRINDNLTAFSAIVGTLGAIAAGLAALFANFAKHEAHDANKQAVVATTSANGAKVSADNANEQAIRAREKAEAAELAIRETRVEIEKLKVRELTEDASYRFAKEFMERLVGLKSVDKEPQMITSALEIIAQASGDKDGKSSAALRAALPIKLALLRGDAGSVATMDPTLKHAGIWLQLARFDDDDLPRTTAIRALCMIARVAAGRKDNELAAKCVVHADELRRLLEEERLRRMQERDDRVRPLEITSPKMDRTIATDRREKARQARLEAFAQMMMLRNYLEDDLGWKEPAESATNESPESPEHAMRLLGLVLVDLFDSEKQLAGGTKKSRDLAASGTPSPDRAPSPSQASSTLPPPVEAPVQQTLALVSDLRAKEETRQAALAPTEDEEKARIDRLIEQLKDPLADRRRAARASLALIGNSAVDKLLAAVTSDVEPDAERRYKLRLGVATALRLMKQPIFVKAEGTPALMILLESSDRETRIAAADFVMDLWDGESVRRIFAELAKLFQNLPDPGKDRNKARAVYNAALIVSTLARTLHDSIQPPTGSTEKTMRAHALQTAIGWRKKLTDSPQRAQWGDTLGILNLLIPRAQTTASTR